MATKTRSSFIPGDEASFNLWAENYVSRIRDNPNIYLLSEPRVEKLVDAQAAFSASLKASVAARDAAKAAIEQKDEDRRALDDVIRSSARIIQADDEVTDAAREKAGLPVHKKSRTPVQVPKTNPVGFIMGTDRLEQTLQYSDAKTPTRKARPHGVAGCEVYMVVADPAPTNPEDFRFVRVVTRATETFAFDSEDGGKTAHYLLRWVNTKGETGPWSPIVSATIPAV